MSSNSNNFRIRFNPNTQQINIPLELQWDNAGRGEAVSAYETEIIRQVINPIDDFETSRFAHKPWNVEETRTDIHYQFFFNSGNTEVSATTNCNDWITDYEAEGFTDAEIFYFSNAFAGSFFKLDFYDSPQSETQRLYFTVILPTQQGLTETGRIGNVNSYDEVQVKKPSFILDYIGDKEGFFIYWLKDQTYLNVDTFYFSAKFFNGKSGQFIRMMNECQGDLPNKFNFNQSEKFYYKCVLDYNTYEYQMYQSTSVPVTALTTTTVIVPTPTTTPTPTGPFYYLMSPCDGVSPNYVARKNGSPAYLGQVYDVSQAPNPPQPATVIGQVTAQAFQGTLLQLTTCSGAAPTPLPVTVTPTITTTTTSVVSTSVVYTQQRVGTESNPIKWYEYVNP